MVIEHCICFKNRATESVSGEKGNFLYKSKNKVRIIPLKLRKSGN